MHTAARHFVPEPPSFWSGLDGVMVSGWLAEILNVPQPAGYLVKTVARGSPGEAVGLRGGTSTAVVKGETLPVGGDIVLRVEGIPVTDTAGQQRIRDIMRTLREQAEFTVTVLRLGRVIELKGRKA